MIADDLKRELLDELDDLPAKEQRQILHYARSVRQALRRTDPGDPMHYFGAWDEETARQVEAAIEEGCEQVNADAW